MTVLGPLTRFVAAQAGGRRASSPSSRPPPHVRIPFAAGGPYCSSPRWSFTSRASSTNWPDKPGSGRAQGGGPALQRGGGDRQAGLCAHFGIGEDEDLLSLASVPFGRLLQRCPQPGALVFHHSYAASAAAHPGPATDGFMPHAQYFPAALLRRFELDHVPYFGSFATGCTGLLSLILTAAGLCAFSQGAPVVCLTADVKPPGTTYDARREKILTSDCASGFLRSAGSPVAIGRWASASIRPSGSCRLARRNRQAHGPDGAGADGGPGDRLHPA